MRRRTALATLAAFPVLIACPKRSLASMQVFAEESAREAVLRAAHEFEILRPGLDLVLEFGASHVLANRIAHGESLDAFVADSQEAFEPFAELGAAPELEIASSPLMIVRPRREDGPKELDQLREGEFRLAVAGEETELGRRTRTLLTGLELEDLLGGAVTVEGTKGTLDALTSGDADLGILLEVDHRLHQRALGKIGIPEEKRVEVRFFASSIGSDESRGGGFVHFLRTEEGRKILKSVGFKTK